MARGRGPVADVGRHSVLGCQYQQAVGFLASRDVSALVQETLP